MDVSFTNYMQKHLPETTRHKKKLGTYQYFMLFFIELYAGVVSAERDKRNSIQQLT